MTVSSEPRGTSTHLIGVEGRDHGTRPMGMVLPDPLHHRPAAGRIPLFPSDVGNWPFRGSTHWLNYFKNLSFISSRRFFLPNYQTQWNFYIILRTLSYPVRCRHWNNLCRTCAPWYINKIVLAKLAGAIRPWRRNPQLKPHGQWKLIFLRKLAFETLYCIVGMKYGFISIQSKY